MEDLFSEVDMLTDAQEIQLLELSGKQNNVHKEREMLQQQNLEQHHIKFMVSKHSPAALEEKL